MRIHTDRNGLAVNAISKTAAGEMVEGHLYSIHVGARTVALEFQRGPVKQHGVNGLTNEALLAVLIHRTCYLDAQFPCAENTQAICAMVRALEALEARTAQRLERGVEGTNSA